MIASMDGLSQVGHALGVVLLVPFYVTQLADYVLRPCANPIDFLLSEKWWLWEFRGRTHKS